MDLRVAADLLSFDRKKYVKGEVRPRIGHERPDGGVGGILIVLLFLLPRP